MSDENHPHPPAHGPAHGSAGHPGSRPRKLHQDWRLWLIVALMLAAMTIYVLTLDLR
jgi:hypothetical protein